MAASYFFLQCPEAMHSMDSGEERGDGVEVCQIEASVLIVLFEKWHPSTLCSSKARSVAFSHSFERRSASKLCVADPKPSKTFRRLFGYVDGEAERATLHQSWRSNIPPPFSLTCPHQANECCWMGMMGIGIHGARWEVATGSWNGLPGSQDSSPKLPEVPRADV